MRYKEAVSAFREGRVDIALKISDESYRDLEKRNAYWSWRFRLLKAESLLWKGQFQDADALLAETIPSGAPSELTARTRILQARVFCRLGKDIESDNAFKEAGVLAATSEPNLQAELAFAQGKCASSAKPDIARSYYQRAADLAHGGDSFVEARSLMDAGYILLRERNCLEAIEKLKLAMSLTDSPPLLELILGNLGECYAELGDWRQSIHFSEQAEALARQIENTGDQEAWLINLGRAHFALAEFSEAGRHYQRALGIAKSQNDSDAQSRCLNDLIQLAVQRHDLSEADLYWNAESALTLPDSRKIYFVSDTASIAMERQDFQRAELLLKNILRSKTNDALRLTTERELGDVYWHEGKTSEADRTFRKAINDAESVIEQLPSQYQMSFLDEDPFYDSYVRFLAAHNRNLEALQIAERGRGKILSQALEDNPGAKSGFDLTPLQAVLKKREQIALAYSLTDEESFLWVITPAQLRLFHLPSHHALRLLIDAYNQEIVNHPRPVEDSPAGQQLYKTLIEPAASFIPKGSSVVVIPSKILSLINFEALVVPGVHPHYWIEDVDIETASSLALLTRPKRPTAKAGRRKELLLLGAPVVADKSFPQLKHAAEEIDRVRSHFPTGQERIVEGQSAVPAAYRASNPGDYRLIHIDAHSVASDLSPLDSFVVLSPAADGYKLYAHDIQQTRLHADLVTISACYSAGSRWYQGEGIVGLGWAFLRAGAHQVVASLWAVDEASTPQLMDDFYRELSQGKPASQALRDAKLNMLHSGGHLSRPYYWASLQLYTGS